MTTTVSEVKFNVITCEQFRQKFLSLESKDPADSIQGDLTCNICYEDLVRERPLNEKMPLLVYHGCHELEKVEESSTQKAVHPIHFECAQTWWVQVKDCPTCRAQVANIDDIFKNATKLSIQSGDGRLQSARYKLLPYLSKMQSMFETSKKLAEASLYIMSINMVVFMVLIALPMLITKNI